MLSPYSPRLRTTHHPIIRNFANSSIPDSRNFHHQRRPITASRFSSNSLRISTDINPMLDARPINSKPTARKAPSTYTHTPVTKIQSRFPTSGDKKTNQPSRHAKNVPPLSQPPRKINKPARARASYRPIHLIPIDPPAVPP